MMSSIEYRTVKANMLSMLKYSKEEFKQYKKTGNVIYLQQAGEKLFNALENYIQFIYKTRYSSMYELLKHTKEKPLRKLLYDARNLHKFFYNGELEMRIDDAEDEYIRISSILESRIKRL